MGYEEEADADAGGDVQETEVERNLGLVDEKEQSSKRHKQRVSASAEYQVDSAWRTTETSRSSGPSISGRDPSTPIADVPVGLDAFATQQLREEVVERETKRKHVELAGEEGAIETKHIHCAVSGKAVGDICVVNHDGPQSPERVLDVDWNSTSPFDPPPSGGEASRANPNVRLYTSFETAIEETRLASYNNSPYLSALGSLPGTPSAVAQDRQRFQNLDYDNVEGRQRRTVVHPVPR